MLVLPEKLYCSTVSVGQAERDLFSPSARLLCVLTAPTKRKMLIGVNECGKKTKLHKIKHTLYHEVGAECFPRDVRFSAYLELCMWF